MKRKIFLKKGLIGFGSIIAGSKTLHSCSEDEANFASMMEDADAGDTASCIATPSETEGPFPNINPAQLARQNIIVDREGVAFLINITVEDLSNNCQPLEGAIIDLWHCDADGYYSQYGNTRLQQADFTDHNFLRGRQVTDANGRASYISIFPGWYSGRAPHIHLEVQDAQENSLLITQLAFPKEVCDVVYATQDYNGEADTRNETDAFFRDSFSENLLDTIEGNITDGYTMTKVLRVRT